MKVLRSPLLLFDLIFEGTEGRFPLLRQCLLLGRSQSLLTGILEISFNLGLFFFESFDLLLGFDQLFSVVVD